jgi:hypothetical protein
MICASDLPPRRARHLVVESDVLLLDGSNRQRLGPIAYHWPASTLTISTAQPEAHGLLVPGLNAEGPRNPVH